MFEKYATCQIFGNDSNKSKLDSGRNKEETEFEQRLLPFRPELFSSFLLSKNIKIRIYETVIFCGSECV
jgi:hypothetical protein